MIGISVYFRGICKTYRANLCLSTEHKINEVKNENHVIELL